MRLAIAIILASLAFHVNAAVVRIQNNFATTNTPTALTNAIKSLGSNVVGSAEIAYSQLPYQPLMTNANGVNLTNFSQASFPAGVTTNSGTLTAVPLSGNGGRGVTAATAAQLGNAISGAVFDASGLTNIPSANLTGTISDARLSGNVVTNYETQATSLTNAANQFVGTFTGLDKLTNAVSALTIVATGGSNIVTLDASLSKKYSLTLTTNIYMMQPSGLVAMGDFAIDIRQNGTGGYSVAWNTNYWKFSNRQVLTTTTNANSWSIASCLVGQFATNVAVVQTLNLQ